VAVSQHVGITVGQHPVGPATVLGGQQNLVGVIQAVVVCVDGQQDPPIALALEQHSPSMQVCVCGSQQLMTPHTCVPFGQRHFPPAFVGVWSFPQQADVLAPTVHSVSGGQQSPPWRPRGLHRWPLQGTHTAAVGAQEHS
jgi:hypothetical protein